MAEHDFPLAALKSEVEALMVANGIVTPHFIGERERHANRDAPIYVWVPGSTRDFDAGPSPSIDQIRSCAVAREGFEVLCWGRDFQQASALRRNLIKALSDAGQADISLESGRWERPGAAFGQRGELWILTASVGIPFLDEYVDPTTLVEPEPETYTPADIEADVHRAPSVDEDGTEPIRVITTP